MSKQHIIAMTLAGIAVSVSGHEFSLIVSATATDIGLSGTYVELNVYGDASVGTHMVGGAFSLSSDSSSITSMRWVPADWSMFNSDGGYAGNGNYNEVVFGQLLIPNAPPFDMPAPGSDLGNLIGTFMVNFLDPGSDGIIDFQLLAGNQFTLEVIDEHIGEFYNDLGNDLELGSFRLYATPSPSSVALIAIAGGIMTCKRRRP